MVPLLLLAACSKDGSGGDDSVGCPSGETLVDGECTGAGDDSGTPNDDSATTVVHARWVSAGARHSCLLFDGEVRCWGKSDEGELDVPEDAGLFVSVDAAAHTCGLSAGKDGLAFCWGPAEYSENFVLGDEYVAITTGDDHGCGFTELGAVCWGSNLEGQSNAPDGPMTALDAGAFHTCGIHEGGRIECWGRSSASPMGNPSFRSVSAGGSASCGLTEAHELRCWGEDAGVVGGFPAGSFEQVSVGGSHACALDAAGSVQCWGSDADGQADVPAGTYAQVSAGTDHTCALTTSGDAVCWGSNADGQADPP
jgi:alpha-tubulin suppressor-like RCC1 family protein